MEKSGWAEVLVVLDDSDVRSFAAQQRKALGLSFDNPAIQAGRVRLLNQKKDAVLSRIPPSAYKALGNYDYFPIVFLKVNANALARLQRMSEVKSINENRIMTPFYTDNQNLINVPGAWTYLSPALPGSGTAVAVVDTGVDYSSGISSCASPGDPGCVAYEHCFATDGCTTDISHGTNVSGIVFQVASDTEVLALDVFSLDALNHNYAYDSDIVAALNWTVANKAAYNIASVNMSLGGSVGYTSPCPNDDLAVAISNVKSAGIAAAVASGNTGWASLLSSPACAPDAISVGAVYDKGYASDEIWSVCTDTAPVISDQVACFSNSSSFLSLLAPGVDITAAGITMSGTSQATPHVAGSVAVLKSQNSLLTVDEEVARLEATGVGVTDGKNNITKPRVDLDAAVSVTSPILVTSPGSFTFGSPGGATPASQTLKIVNGGADTMNWTVDNGGSMWLTPVHLLGSGSSNVSVGIDTTGLSPGTYNGQLTIDATDSLGNAAAGSPSMIPVTLEVLDPAYGDGFETGDLAGLPWVTGGNGSWFVQIGTVHNGSYAAQSPGMSDSQSSYIQVTLNVTTAGYVYFWLKTDTEPYFDNLKFYVDGNNEGEFYGWSGNTDWTMARSEHEVAPGVHIFKWVYSKDSSVSQGSDTVWLDDIFFPEFNTVSITPESYDFGAVPLGQSKTETFNVSNFGGSSVTLGSVSLSGTDAAEFGLGSDSCSGGTIAPGGGCAVDVVFSPASLAEGKSASLLIPQTGSSAVTSASLTGTGGNIYTLAINKNTINATGTGRVFSSAPTGVIDCGPLCSAQVLQDTQVTLSAQADSGSYFSGWSSGGCSGTGTCTVTMTSDTTISATFETISPTADFSGNPLSGPAPLEVTFTDASSSNTTAWSWNFGDGGQSSLQNPIYTYTNPGTYSVSLTVANAGGSNTMTKNSYVSVNCPLLDVRIPRNTSLYYSTVQPAFDNAFSYGDTVEIHDGATIVDTPSLGGFRTVTLRGGYDACFTASSGYSTIQGSLTVGSGTLTVDGIIIQ